MPAISISAQGFAAAKGRRFGIVIAAEPNPLANRRAKRGQLLLIHGGHAFARQDVVEAIAETDHALRAVGFDCALQAMERVAAVKRGEQAALGRGARALFEMQVRDNERAMRARVGGAGVVERQREPRELDLNCGLAPAGRLARARVLYLAMRYRIPAIASRSLASSCHFSPRREGTPARSAAGILRVPSPLRGEGQGEGVFCHSQAKQLGQFCTTTFRIRASG